MSEKRSEEWKTFRALVESADRKFGRVRDAGAYGRAFREFQKVFKAYMRVWKYQQEHRASLVESGLTRWEIGDIASRIGQLYFGHYLRTSECRFLAESCVFYEAILSRSYFEDSHSHLSVRFKELRFYARFLQVALLLSRKQLVHLLFNRFSSVLQHSKATFRETDFKEWGQVIEEAVRFMNADSVLCCSKMMRYCPLSVVQSPQLSRFHAMKVLKFRDALLCGYHRKEVKFAEITLDAFRMMQCLEWDPHALFSPNHNSNKTNTTTQNGAHSGPSGLIDINVTDPSLPPNPRKAVLYRPSVTHLISVMATICEELPPDSVILVYLSASGHPECSPRNKPLSLNHLNNALPNLDTDSSNGLYDRYLWFGPKGRGGSNNLYPGDFVPFTRRPLFFIIDSDTSHAFKAIHGVEMGEPAALLLSPLRSSFKKQPCDADQYGSQFTLFLTSPLSAFCLLVGLSSSDVEADVLDEAEDIIAAAFCEWEVILCTLTCLDLVWGQVWCDPFLRRLILRSVLFLFCDSKDKEQCVPTCLPPLPNSVSSHSQVVKAVVHRLANHFRVSECFHSEPTS